jgi:hypothetical protein
LHGENDETQQNISHASSLSICVELTDFEQKWHHGNGEKKWMVGSSV